ncbi:protein translocase subunit SecF [bacterium]|nr:protein translocase subunit SecF [bacterium]|tara:strand:- start:13808 stop:14704 length:897 start_codon:yes stop_codon:yes gene_type:complete
MNKKLNFLKMSKITVWVSLLILTMGIFSMIQNTKTFKMEKADGTISSLPLNLGIEFTGGSVFEVNLGEESSTTELRELLSESLTKNPQIQKSGDVYIIRTEFISNPDEIYLLLESKYKNFNKDEDVSSERIGPLFSQELAKRAYLATFIGMLVILLYISIRFSFIFAQGALVALVHDILFVLSYFAIFKVEIGLPFVAAILTILGYSINDTIVVFDRIRENMNKLKNEKFSKICETSLWQTLSRTINTTTTTLLAIMAIQIFGGATLKPFTTALIVGFIAGTYSSIFIATPYVNSKQK